MSLYPSAAARMMTTVAGRPPVPFTKETAPAFVTVSEAALLLGCPQSVVLDAISQKRLATAPSLTPRVVRIPRAALWPTNSAEPVRLADTGTPTPPPSR